MDISHPPMPANFLGPFSSEEGHPWRQEYSSALNEALRDWRGECPLGREGGSSDGPDHLSDPSTSGGSCMWLCCGASLSRV